MQMIPNAAEITRRRVTAATVLRLFAVFMAQLALIPAFEMLSIWTNPDHWNFGNPSALIIPAIGAAVILSVSAIIWALAPWAARRAIRVPRVNTCPGCRYKLQGLNTPQCPECGLTLTPEYLSPDLEPDRRETDTILLRQICVLVLRGASVLAAIPFFVRFFSGLVYFLTGGFNYISSFAEVVTMVLTPAIGLAVAGGIIVSAKRLAIVIVPQRAALGGRDGGPTEQPDGA